MAERCGQTWDGYCDAFVALNTETYWPNQGVVDQLAYANAKQFWRMTTSVGEDLIRNTMYQRYICPQGIHVTQEPFDPNVANSPQIHMFDNYAPYYSKVVGLQDPTVVRQDAHILKMLDHAKVCTDVLGRIYLGYLRKEPDVQIHGSILEDFFQQNESVLQQYVQQAIQNVPSFQIQNQPPYSSSYAEGPRS